MSKFKPIEWTAAAVVALSATAVSAQGGDAMKDIATGPVPSWARPSEPLPIPVDTTGPAFIRAQDVVIHLDKSGQSTFLAQRVALLQPQALQLGNLALTWNPASGEPVIHAVRIHRGSRTIDVLEGTKFEVLRREDQLEESMITGVLTAVLKVPDLRVGDDLEIAYTLPTGDPTLGDLSSGILTVQGSPLPGRFRLGLNWDKGQEPRTHMTDDFGTAVERSANAVDIRLDNPEAVVPPNDAPPRYNWKRFLEYSDFSAWSDIAERFHALFTAAAKIPPGSALAEEVAQIAADHATKKEQAAAALVLVQNQVRYIYVGLDGGNYRPASAEETWQRRYGDCKAKTALLLALLGELGIPAEAVLAQNAGLDDGLDTRLPSPALFDHVLVRAEIDGEDYWLDGTMPGVVEMSTQPILPYRWVLPLLAKGAKLEKVPEPLADLPDEMGLFEIDARAGFDKPAHKVQTTVKRGIDGIAEYVTYSSVSADQLKNAVRNSYIGNGDWEEVEEVTYRYDRKTRASILTVSGSGRVDWDDEGGGGRSLTLPGGGFSPPPRRQRPSDQDQSAPYFNSGGYSCYATTVRLPEDTDVENWDFNSTYDTMLFNRLYYRMIAPNDDGTIRMVRASRVPRGDVSVETVRRDNNRIDNFDNSKAIITYNPRHRIKTMGSHPQVPTTYGFDWTGTDAPCLPEDVR